MRAMILGLGACFAALIACSVESAEDTTSGEDEVSAAKKSCAFSFTKAAAPFGGSRFQSGGSTAGVRQFFLGDFDGDKQTDIVRLEELANAARIRAVYGAGDGTFGDSISTAVSDGIGRGFRGIGTGDFDGDSRDDILAQNLTGPDKGTYVILFGREDRKFDMVMQPQLGEVTVRPSFEHRIADFDGDGRADVVWIHQSSDKAMIAFGGARTLVLGKSFIEEAHGGGASAMDSLRSSDPAKAAALAFKSGRFGVTVSWNAERKHTITSTDLSAGVVGTEAAIGDFDRDGTAEVASFLGDKLAIDSVAEGHAPALFALHGRGGRAIDLNADGRTELVYRATPRSTDGGLGAIDPDAGGAFDRNEALFAACGFTPKAKALVGTPLGIPLTEGGDLLGVIDLNGDGKPDFVVRQDNESPIDVWLSAKPPRPPTQFTIDKITAASDAGVEPERDASLDATTDASSADSDNPLDAGPDAEDRVTTKDAGAQDTPVDAAAGRDDSDEGKESEASSTETGSSQSSTSSGTKTNRAAPAIEKPIAKADDGGCSASPARANGSSGLRGGLGVLIAFVFARRRRRAGR